MYILYRHGVWATQGGMAKGSRSPPPPKMSILCNLYIYKSKKKHPKNLALCSPLFKPPPL